MKNTMILIAALAAAVCFGFAQQANKQAQQTNKPSSKMAELKSEGFHFPDNGTKEANNKYLKTILTGPYVNLPYHIDVADMQVPLRKVSTPKDAAITNLINGERGLFSRAPMRSYEYVATVGNYANFHLIVYRRGNTYGDDAYPLKYFMVSLDNNGKQIESLLLAALNSPLDVRTGVINPDGTIQCNDIKQTWQNDPLVSGYKNNKVIKSEVVKINSYKISADGNITNVNEPAPAEVRN